MNHVSVSQLVRKARRVISGAPSRLQVAALPWRRSKAGIELMLVTSRDTGRWVLPKGWPETGEEFCDAAAREAQEEAGLAGSVAPGIAGRYSYVKTGNGTGKRCEVMVYPLEVAQVAGKWKEKGERRRKWFSPAKAAEAVAEPELAELILAFAGRRAA
jgi:8-oxo-dGTP pyrophosphatase MutT (NUDIX family)